MMGSDRVEMHEAYGSKSVLTFAARFLSASNIPYQRSTSRNGNVMKNVGISCEYTFLMARLPQPPKPLFRLFVFRYVTRRTKSMLIAIQEQVA